MTELLNLIFVQLTREMTQVATGNGVAGVAASNTLLGFPQIAVIMHVFENLENIEFPWSFPLGLMKGRKKLTSCGVNELGDFPHFLKPPGEFHLIVISTTIILV